MTNLQDPETAALTHQASRWFGRALAPSCGKCIAREDCEAYREGGTCALAEAAQADLLAAVVEEVAVTPAMLPVAREYAKVCVGIQVIDTYLGAHSPFLPGADVGYLEPQPVMKLRGTLSSRLQSLASELGLTPAAKARLRADPDRGPGADLAAAIRELASTDRARDAKTLDAECEPITEAGGSDD